MKIRMLITLLLLSLLLTSCGSPKAESKTETAVVETTENTAAKSENTTTEAAGESSAPEKAAEETSAAPENQFALFTSKEQKGISSTLITFDADKVRIADECRNASAYTYFENIENPASTLFVCFYEESAEELYNSTINGFSSNMRENITLTDIAELTVGDLTFQTYDVFYKGELRAQHYMLELDNGYILHNGGGRGYEPDEVNNIPFEEMLADVFVKLEEGDGTSIRPSWGFEKDNDGSAVTYTFDSGEVFVLDYPEDQVEISATGFVVNITFLNEKLEENVTLKMHMSRKYDSLEPYIAAEEAKGYIYEDLEIKHADINGLDMTYVCEDPGSSNSVYGLYYIELPNGFSLRGDYRNFYEDFAVSLPEAVGLVLGAEVEIDPAAGGADQMTASGLPQDLLADLTAFYNYTEPSRLGDTVDSLTYSIDNVVYQFPTPVSVFLQNDWMIPEVFKTKYPEVHYDDYVSIALENENGGILYDVVVTNRTGASAVSLEECIVVMMKVTQSSAVAFELPENVSFDCTPDELNTIPGVNSMQNGSYTTFTWWNDDTNCTVSAWYHPDIDIEYFEFAQ